jgi:hypothetical protein
MIAPASAGERRGLPREVLVVWALFVVVAVEIFVTYERIPPGELYHVSGEGFAGAASRVLVFSNFPLALVALTVILLLVDRLPGRTAAVVAGIGLASSAVVFWPGVVDQDDLDAKAGNAVPALGVAIAAGMTIAVAVRGGLERWQPARQLDWLRVVLGVGVIFVAVPWLLADLGISLDGVPVLGSIWQTGELRTQPGDPMLHPAVHHGHHHGMDGTLLLWSALLLSRTLPAFRRRALGRVTAVLLSLMLVYGLAEIANDGWLEQIVKRGWTDWEIPDMTRPSVSLGWLAILIGTVLVYALWFGRDELAGEREDAGALSSRPANTPS